MPTFAQRARECGLRNPFSRRRIAGRLRLHSLAVALPLMLLGGILVYQTWVVRPQRVVEDALELAQEGSQQVDEFLTRTGKVLTALARVPQVQGFRAEEVSALLQDLNERYPEYEGLFLADARGQIVSGSPTEGIGIQVGDLPYFQQAMSSGQMAVSDVLISQPTGRPTVVVAYPVVGPDGQPLGILAASVDLAYLPISLSRARLQQEYRLTVFDRVGQMVFQAGPPGLALDPSQCTRCHAAPMPAGPMPPRTWMAEDQFHGLSTTSLGWHVVVDAPSSVVLGAAQREAWAALGLIVVILIISAAVAHTLGHRLTRPIVALTEAARRFGAGEAVEPLPATARDEVGVLTQSFNHMVRDISEGRRRLEERQRQLALLRAIDQAVSSDLSLPAVLETLAEEVHGLPAVDGVAVYVLNEEGNLTLGTSRGLPRSAIAGGASCEAMARRALQTRTPITEEGTHEACPEVAPGQKRWCLAAALAARGRSLGAILFCTAQPHGFKPQEMEFLSTLALQASAAADNAHLYGLERRRAAELEALTEALREGTAQLQRAHEGIVETLNLSLQARDPYTKGHAERVSLLARRMARRLGLPRKRQELLARAALLHDVGKIGIPNHLLHKEGPLTPPERAQFQLHPERSAELLRHLPDLGQLGPAIRGHHERYDGKGYPDGLEGEEIDLEARIIAVADGYDALTTDRPYRPALSHQEALGVLRSGAGTQWDPRVVQALIGSFQQEALEET